MIISLIAAISENGVIGKDNALPWHLPEELKFFKEKTLNKPVIMGRKTFESMGKPLPKRLNIVLTEQKGIQISGCTVVHSVTEALAAAETQEHAEEVMIIGGAKIYELFLPKTSKMYLSIIHKTIEGDTFFPNINWNDWKLMEEKSHTDFTTKLFERKNK